MTNGEELWKVIMGVALRTLFNFILVFLLAEGFLYSYRFSYRLFSDIAYKPGVTQTVVVNIPAGSNAIDAARILDDYELVDSEYLILARMFLGKYNTKILAGNYTLAPSMTPDEICRSICGIKSEENNDS